MMSLSKRWLCLALPVTVNGRGDILNHDATFGAFRTDLKRNLKSISCVHFNEVAGKAIPSICPFEHMHRQISSGSDRHHAFSFKKCEISNTLRANVKLETVCLSGAIECIRRRTYRRSDR